MATVSISDRFPVWQLLPAVAYFGATFLPASGVCVVKRPDSADCRVGNSHDFPLRARFDPTLLAVANGVFQPSCASCPSWFHVVRLRSTDVHKQVSTTKDTTFTKVLGSNSRGFASSRGSLPGAGICTPASDLVNYSEGRWRWSPLDAAETLMIQSLQASGIWPTDVVHLSSAA